jgi:ParB family chromosome partitioning protein
MQSGALGDGQAVQIDLHRLELRFANARIVDGAAVQRLANSIHEEGQLVACIAAGQPQAGALVLIDGYRRVAALSRLGRDTALVQCWSCPLEQALAQMLARSMSRTFAPIEEAMLLRELIDTHGLSQRQAARLCARDVSWVQRRLVLLGQLPEPLVQAVRTSRVSSWAAARIFVPLARANSEHASSVLDSLQVNKLSTRELRTWFEHYQGAQRSQRERMVQHPRLFIESLNARDRDHAAQRLRDGPERELTGELGHLQWLLARVRRRLEQLDTPLAAPVAMACRRVHAALPGLNNELRRLCHDPDGDSRQHTGPAPGRHEPARDQQAAQALA